MGSLPSPPVVIDLSTIFSDDLSLFHETGRSLVSSLREHGFAKLFDSSPKVENLCETLALAKAFFAMPDQAKMSAAHPEAPSPHRGYSYVGQEKLSGVTGFLDGHTETSVLLDLKETFDMGKPVDHHYPNRWPDDKSLPGFKTAMENAFESLHQVLLQVLRMIAIDLGLPPDSLANRHDASHHELRLLHYPPTDRSVLNSTHTRIADHTDFGTVTFLLQDNTGGLEGRSRFGDQYFGLDSSEGEILVILGDCFQRWTGDLLWAIPHRVTAPRALVAGQADEKCADRYSVAFFGKPNRDVIVGNLEGAQFQGTKYDAIMAQAYNDSKLTKTY